MPPRDHRTVLLLLVALTLAVAASRTLGLDAFLPQQHEPDPYCVLQAEFLAARAAGEVDTPEEYFGPENVRLFYYYPLHIARLWLLQARPQPPSERLSAETLEGHLASAREPLLRGRRWSAWLSALMVPGIFLLARRFVGAWTALLAAALAGSSLLHLVYSGQARPHAIAAAAAVFGLWGTTAMRRSPDVRGLTLGGLGFALGASAMHNGVVLFAPFLAAFLLQDRKGPRARLLLWVIPLVLFYGAYTFFSPGYLIPPAEESQQSYEGFRVEDGAFIGLGHRIELSTFAFRRPWATFQALWGYDPAHLLLAGLGVLALARAWRRAERGARRDGWVLVAHALPYTLLLASYAKTVDRYALPLLPHVCVLAAAGVASAAIPVSRRWPRGRVALAGTAAALALALPVAGQVARLRLRTVPDTMELATEWVQRNVPNQGKGAGIATAPGIVFPLVYHPASLPSALRVWRANPWLVYQSGLDEARAPEDGWSFLGLPINEREFAAPLRDADRARALVRGLGVRYVVIENSQRARAFGPVFLNLRDALKAEGRLAQRFVPREGKQLPFLDFGQGPDMLWRTFDQERFGPPIEIWRLGAPPR